MWMTLLGWLAPLVLHFGIEAVLRRFPGLPAWLVTILRDLEGAQKAAAALPAQQQPAALAAAKGDAIKKVYLACSGVACPPDLVK